MSKVLDDLYLFLLILPILVPIWLALGGTGGRYLRSKVGQKWVFRPPLAGTLALITVPVWVFLTIRFSLTERTALVLFLKSIPAHPQTQQMLLVTGLVIAAIYGVAVLWFKSWWYIRLDQDKLLWRSLDISQLPFHVKTGPWSELIGVRVLKTDTRSASNFAPRARATFCFVQLVCSDHVCHDPAGLYSTLGKFDSFEDAEQFAVQMAHELNLPNLPVRNG